MTTTQRIYTTLAIYSSTIDPGSISQTLGMQPDRATVKGSKLPNKTEAQKNVWYLSSKNKVDSTEPEVHMSWILEKVTGVAGAINNIVLNGGEIKIWMYLETSERNSGFALSKNILHKICDLEASISLDLYFTDEDSTE